jgi:hypothetical protein
MTVNPVLWNGTETLDRKRYPKQNDEKPGVNQDISLGIRQSQSADQYLLIFLALQGETDFSIDKY